MIGFPYPKRLNSNNAVEQGAAVLLCSVEAAERLGVPRDRWVFPHAGTDAHDTAVRRRARRDLHSSPAIRVAGRRALELAGVGVDDLAHVDLYSCFPSAVQVGGRRARASASTAQLTVTGGLSFAGGPWNNYVTHAIATMARRAARATPATLGLVTANGGFLTKHAFGVYGTEPPAAGFRWEEPAGRGRRRRPPPTRRRRGLRRRRSPSRRYTVMHDRDGAPERRHRRPAHRRRRPAPGAPATTPAVLAPGDHRRTASAPRPSSRPTAPSTLT